MERRGLLDDRLILPPVAAEQGRCCRQSLIAGRGQPGYMSVPQPRWRPQRGSDLGTWSAAVASMSGAVTRCDSSRPSTDGARTGRRTDPWVLGNNRK